MKHAVTVTLSGWFALALPGAQDASFPRAANASEGQSPPVTVGGFRFGTYRITSLDRLNVSVFGEPELTVSEIVDRHGMIHLRLIGEIRIASLTINEVEEKIEQEYINRRPRVRIRIMDYAPQEVLMLGNVRKPGPFRFPPEVEAMDIVEAIARSGGTTALAQPKKVTVKRKTEDGFDVFRVDLRELQKGLEQGNDEGRFFLRPGDVVFVPERIL